MRIIDILNDYANGKIKDGFKFRSGNYNWVIEEDGIHSINQYMSHDGMGEYVYFEDCFELSNLNDEVEIIEEPKELKEITLQYSNTQKEKNRLFKDTINEIIRYIKYKENK